MRLLLAASGLALCCVPALADDSADTIRTAAYAGTLVGQAAALSEDCDAGDGTACFGSGLAHLVASYQGLAQGFYRHGAVMAGDSGVGLVLGMGSGPLEAPRPPNPDPEPLDYAQFRTLLEGFVTGLDAARARFEQAGEAGDFTLPLDLLQVALDLDGDGQISAGESLAPVLIASEILPPVPLDTPADQPPSLVIDFDNADGFWFAGYSQVVAAPVDWVLAHDFSSFFTGYMHRFFPEAGLPLGAHVTSPGGVRQGLFMDSTSEIGIADTIAAIHTLNWPVTDQARLAGVRTRLKAVPALSRRNWQAILGETDSGRELVPSPTQTGIAPDVIVTEDQVDAWLETLEAVDKVLDGELLLPHWRFAQGFDLRAYFETAERTDLVLLITGLDALPYLKDGPIAAAENFRAANATFGDQLFPYALWFN